jgi:hypothetical protein
LRLPLFPVKPWVVFFEARSRLAKKHPIFWKRCAEIRIRFLPHPQIEIGDDDLWALVPEGAA